MSDSLLFIEELERHVKGLYSSLEDGSYEFADEDLPYMNLVRAHGLIALHLLTIINDTHRSGLDAKG